MFAPKKEVDKMRENNNLLERTVDALQEICFRQISVIEKLKDDATQKELARLRRENELLMIILGGRDDDGDG